MVALCREEGIPYEPRSQLIVATTEAEAASLHELHQASCAGASAAGAAYGVELLRTPSEVRAVEPHVHGLAALLVRDSGVVDYRVSY